MGMSTEVYVGPMLVVTLPARVEKKFVGMKSPATGKTIYEPGVKFCPESGEKLVETYVDDEVTDDPFEHVEVDEFIRVDSYSNPKIVEDPVFGRIRRYAMLPNCTTIGQSLAYGDFTANEGMTFEALEQFRERYKDSIEALSKKFGAARVSCTFGTAHRCS